MTQTNVTFSPEQQLILDAVANGLEPNQACRAAGIHPETLRRWREIVAGRETHPASPGIRVRPQTRSNLVAFVEALEDARAKGFAQLVERLQHNASTPNPKTGWYDTQAIDKILSKSEFRKFWFERQPEALEPRTIDGVYREVRELSDDELEQTLIDAGQAPWALPPAPQPQDQGGWPEHGAAD